MALYRILVVDDSPAVRETVSILLGNDYEVHAARAQDVAARGVPEPIPDLIIAQRTAGGDICGHLPGHVPLLWIDPRPSGAVATSLGCFSPRELRKRVAELLSAPVAGPQGPARGEDWRLREPFLSAGAARTVAHAVETSLPLHLIGEAGSGRRSLARAVHGARRVGGPFLALSGLDFDPSVLARGGADGGTLFIDAVDRLSGPAQHRLAGALEPSGVLHTEDGASWRLITAAHEDLDHLTESGAFAAALFYRITVLTARLPPLRERSRDIPALVRLLAAELGPLLGRPQVAFTEGALERLSHYLWFGNLAELEAVLARTIALSRDSLIDADALLFDGMTAPATAPRLGPGPASAPTAAAGQPLDLLINELAHEFKNPLVTIKTFAHHLRRSLPRGGDDEHVARLTGEAVQQIDQTLENLLEFTRLEAPILQSIPLAAVLNPALAECSHSLATRGVTLEQGPVPRVVVRGDPQQLAYALSNLLRALTRDLPPQSRLTVRSDELGAILVTLPDGAVPLSSHLATLLDRPPEGSTAIPLGVAIAHAVLARNGAQVAVADSTPLTLSVRFARADDDSVVAGNGTAPRTGG